MNDEITARRYHQDAVATYRRMATAARAAGDTREAEHLERLAAGTESARLDADGVDGAALAEDALYYEVGAAHFRMDAADAQGRVADVARERSIMDRGLEKLAQLRARRLRADAAAAKVRQYREDDASAQPTAADMLRAQAELGGRVRLGTAPSEQAVAERATYYAASRAGAERAMADRAAAAARSDEAVRDDGSREHLARKMAGDMADKAREAAKTIGDHPLAKRFTAHATELERIAAGTDSTGDDGDDGDEPDDADRTDANDNPINRWKRPLPSAVAARRRRDEGR